jgi:type IV pilus biogenesis protein CpaD/CtpE
MDTLTPVHRPATGEVASLLPSGADNPVTAAIAALQQRHRLSADDVGARNMIMRPELGG